MSQELSEKLMLWFFCTVYRHFLFLRDKLGRFSHNPNSPTELFPKWFQNSLLLL